MPYSSVYFSLLLVIFFVIITYNDSYAYGILVKPTTTSNNAMMMIPATKELFSVAPMMAHTNRHYHYFFRLLSSKSHLYTEMIPAAQIIEAFKNNDHDRLDELLRMHDSPSDNGPSSCVTLQLGGNDPDIVAEASRIGTSYGYNAINLNCGCPSNAVCGRYSGGASLMKEPELVKKIVEAMSEAIPSDDVELSVKHRLSTADAFTYDAEWDRTQTDDDEAFRSCLKFAQAVTESGTVTKLHIHARLALLGDYSDDDLLVEPQTTKTKRGGARSSSATIKNRNVPPLRPNVIHRLADALPDVDFVTNGGIRSLQEIPGRLLPDSVVVEEQDWQKEAKKNNNNVIGAMVGRAVVNHPCSFSLADELWGGSYCEGDSSKKTRREVLEIFAEYCSKEEERLRYWEPSMRDTLRRRLIAVPFTLFWGEDGNNAYQRRIRKLARRVQNHSACSILKAALAEVPMCVQDKPVSEFSLYEEAGETYHDYKQRSGPLQRSIL